MKTREQIMRDNGIEFTKGYWAYDAVLKSMKDYKDQFFKNKTLDSIDDYYAKCLSCSLIHKNWSGSTPCCGSLSNLCDKNGVEI